MESLITSRRSLLLAPMLAAMAGALSAETAMADTGGKSNLDPAMTTLRLPGAIRWATPPGLKGVEMAPLVGNSLEPGLYLVLIRWYPGYMSAPHWYARDRNAVVVSGTWWIGNGETFDPDHTVPAPAGSFVKRVARTPHYDGVKTGAKEPAVIAMCGEGPIPFNLVGPGPGWRKLD